MWHIFGYLIPLLLPPEKKLNFKLYIFDSVFFLLIVPIIFIFTNNLNLIYSMLAFGVFAIVGEYSFSYIFHLICGFKLFEYDKGNIFGYTSYLNFPFYCGGFLFIFVLNSVVLNLIGTSLSNAPSTGLPYYNIIFSIIALITMIPAGLSFYFPANDGKTRLKAYLDIFMTALLFVIVAMGITKDLNIFVMFIVNTLFVWVGEVILGVSLQIGTGYQHWKYNKLGICGGYTSPLIFPLWGLAGVVVYILMVVFR